jgi:hypothetical protein
MNNNNSPGNFHNNTHSGNFPGIFSFNYFSPSLFFCEPVPGIIWEIFSFFGGTRVTATVVGLPADENPHNYYEEVEKMFKNWKAHITRDYFVQAFFKEPSQVKKIKKFVFKYQNFFSFFGSIFFFFLKNFLNIFFIQEIWTLFVDFEKLAEILKTDCQLSVVKFSLFSNYIHGEVVEVRGKKIFLPF